MQISDLLVSFLGIFIIQYGVLLCYRSLSKKHREKDNLKNIVITLLCTVLFYVIGIYYYGVFKVVLNFALYAIQNKLIFKEDFKKVLIKTFIIYSLLFLVDTFLILILIEVGYESIQHFDKYAWAKNIYTLVEILIVCLIFMIKPFRNKIKDLVNEHSDKLFNFLIIIVILIYALVSYRSIINFNSDDFLINAVILACFITLSIILIIQNSKKKLAEEKQNVLLEFLTKYEKIIDNDRINRHEMLNNLLMIKSQKNRNSQKFELMLNDIINLYENHDTGLTHNIYNLPSGLKGILYYKIYEMKQLGIDVNLLISDKIITKINNLSRESYKTVFKIVGILLDNAREESLLSEDKKIFIELYSEKDNLIIHVENTIKSKIDLKIIARRGYSTKGKNRGMGLYIANKLLEKDPSINLVQEVIDKQFISKLIIQTK